MMDAFLHVLHDVVMTVTEILINLFELFGALIILYVGIITVYKFFRLRFTQTSTELRIRFGRTISLGLLFYLAAEIFKMITIRDTETLIIVGVIIILHIVISVLVAWEVEHGLKVVREEQELDRECEDGECD
jgi:uncharacterized membrane protein